MGMYTFTGQRNMEVQIQNEWQKRNGVRGWHGFPGPKFLNTLDHLQRALHLHQAVEWRAALGQRMPARREQRLGGSGIVTLCTYLSVLCLPQEQS